MFVIGKAARPRSFPKSFEPMRDLEVCYAYKTARMTAAEFSRWIKGVNSEMKRCGLLACESADKCADNCHDTLLYQPALVQTQTMLSELQ
jgi:hypothetical protein